VGQKTESVIRDSHPLQGGVKSKLMHGTRRTCCRGPDLGEHSESAVQVQTNSMRTGHTQVRQEGVRYKEGIRRMDRRRGSRKNERRRKATSTDLQNGARRC
jgi:hypothetical protein